MIDSLGGEFIPNKKNNDAEPDSNDVAQEAVDADRDAIPEYIAVAPGQEL